MNSDYILVSGLKDPQRLEAYFASNLVDIAYAEPISGSSMKVLVEPDTDLRTQNNVDWILGLVIDALRSNEETAFVAEIVRGV
jgi:hypothetical protein